MATVTWTLAVGEDQVKIRRLAKKLEQIANAVGDKNNGASLVLTFDNNPSGGVFSVASTGSYSSGTLLV